MSKVENFIDIIVLEHNLINSVIISNMIKSPTTSGLSIPSADLSVAVQRYALTG